MEESRPKKQTVTDDGIYFSIREVAEQVGVTPATIRNWEKQGLFIPKRGSNGYRQFNFSDIETLQRIRMLSRRKVILPTHIGNTDPYHADALIKEDSGSKRLLSEKWKDSRLKRNYSLEQVARSVGISPSYLSKIENMQASISLDILKRLANFYGENILYYIGSATRESNLVRKDEGENLSVGMPGVDLFSVVALRDFAISAVIYHIQPGSSRQDVSTHSGQEFIHVLTGSIQFTLRQEQVYQLKKGDSLSFRSSEAHQWYNNTAKPVSLLWIYVPA